MAWSADEQIRGAAGEFLDGYGENGGVVEVEIRAVKTDIGPMIRLALPLVWKKRQRAFAKQILSFGASSWRQSWCKRLRSFHLALLPTARHAGWLGMAWNILTLPKTTKLETDGIHGYVKDF